ncbi:MAG TPA: VOC family protein [Candidatus Binatia bacterium]|nr:VOC family protein [Candidatus Binatia bacterium]
MTLTVSAIVVDCRDPERVGRFWSAALSRPLEGGEEGVWWWLELGQGGPGILFLQNPDAKVVKNRLHLDLRPDDQLREVERLTGLGARRKDIGQGEVGWVVMGDPEDNEFCVLEPESSTPEPG